MDQDQKGSVSYDELAERWPAIFGPEGLVSPEEFELVQERAYSVELTEEGLRVGFAFDHEEAATAFEDGADMVGRLVPDTNKMTTLNIDKGCIVYAELGWENTDDD
jgi:hypothetical protein